MFTFNEMPSLSSLFSTFASIAASIMLFRSMVYQILPQEVSDYLISLLQNLFKAHYVPTLTFVFDEGNEFIGRNQIFEAACVYLDTLHSPETKRLNVRQSAKEKGLIIRLENGEKVTDFYDGIELYWKFVCSEQGNSSSVNRYHSHSSEKRFFELSFHNKHREKVSKLYLPFIVGKAKAISDENRFLKMFTLSDSFDPGLRWESTNLEHPATLETLAMDQDKKTDIIEDLNRFVKRKEFYKKVGRAWKRGYLLYGPPGTGKSSLVAAMANHLKFDIYDLQLANIKRDTVLRRLLLATANRSILVIEDIDCSVCLPDRLHGEKEKESGHQNNKNSAGTSLTLSGLLNFIDGLWSSCGDERIIIFTTNHKDRLDPALLRPGRMDKHIHMGYCTYEAFKQLASRYLGITSDHQLYGEIKGLLDEAKVTPAQVAEGFLKYEDADFALEEFLKLLKGKKMEGHDDEYCEGKTDENENENIVLLDLRDPKGTK